MSRRTWLLLHALIVLVWLLGVIAIVHSSIDENATTEWIDDGNNEEG